jgi:hypothetical protein
MNNMNSEDVIVAPRPKEYGFVGSLFSGLKSLLGGMKITFGYFGAPLDGDHAAIS